MNDSSEARWAIAPRESPAFLLADEAKRRGFVPAIHDPLVRPGPSHGHEVTRDLKAVLAGADAAILITDHETFKTLGPKDFAGMRGKWIYDGRNCLNHAELRKAGFTVIVLGVGGAL